MDENAESDDAHVDQMLSPADLCRFGAFADEFQGQFFTLVAEGVLGMIHKRMLVPVTLVQIFGVTRTAASFRPQRLSKMHVFAVQLERSALSPCRWQDVADAVARGILCPGFDGQVTSCPFATVRHRRAGSHSIFTS